MTRSLNRARLGFVLLAVLGTSLVSAPAATAQSTIEIQCMEVEIDLLANGPKPFVLTGEASGLGEFAAMGEMELVPGEREGSLVGAGPVVFRAANGGLLVGVMTWDFGPRVQGTGSVRIDFAWREAVRFSDGTVLGNTGGFEDRPVGLVVHPWSQFVWKAVRNAVEHAVKVVVETIRNLP